MKKVILFLLFSVGCFGQQTDSIPGIERTIPIDDPFYREDQFYFSVTHSILQDKPSGFKQKSMSTGLTFGFLRDIPVNKKRTIAFAPGIGFAFYNLRHNIIALNPASNDYLIDSNYDKNKQDLWYVEVPLELRWRSSTMESHKFWRVYLGVKYSYLLGNTSKYTGYLGNTTVRNNPDFSKSNLGMYISAGFNTWNVYAYYGFNPIYKKGTFSTGDLRFFNVGLMFYIL